jgi:membrane associated rhomboid family serine protease
MSLSYENQPETIDEPEENFRRAAPAVPYYSIVFVGCLIFVFIAQLSAESSGSILGHGNISPIIAGFVKPFFREGQYWRILTGATLHGGLLHLFFNSYALFSFGRLIETLSNRAHLAIVFLLSVIAGGVLSFIFLPDGRSVGASGGIVGLLGYMTAYAFKRRKLLPDGFLKNMLFNIGFLAFLGIYVLPNIDNFAHLGGLIAGVVYGFLQIPGDLYKDPTETGSTMRIFGVAALVVFIVTAIFSILLLLGIIPVGFPELGA